MCQKRGKRKTIDLLEGARQYFKKDSYGWNTFVNAKYHGIKFNGSSDEFCEYSRRRPVREAYLAKLWRYHNVTNIL